MLSATRIKRWWRRAQMMHGGIVWVILALSALGLVMQYSAAGGDPRIFMLPQAVRLVMGLALMVAVAITPTPTLFRLSYLLYGICLLLLVIVEVFVPSW